MRPIEEIVKSRDKVENLLDLIKLGPDHILSISNALEEVALTERFNLIERIEEEGLKAPMIVYYNYQSQSYYEDIFADKYLEAIVN